VPLDYNRGAGKMPAVPVVLYWTAGFPACPQVQEQWHGVIERTADNIGVTFSKNLVQITLKNILKNYKYTKIYT
jgi:hypothetical protein